MCDPVTMTLASVAITGASSIMQYEGERRAANQQADAIRQNQSFNDAALQAQQVEVDQQSSQQMSERSRQAMIERGKLIAAFSSSGLGGNSQGVAVNETSFLEGTDIASIEANRASRQVQIQRERGSQYRQAKNNLASIKVPNPLAVGLQIAGAGFNTYTSTTRPPPNKAG